MEKFNSEMGFTKRVVYKPVDDIDLSANSDEVYIRADVKAPRMAGLLVKIFVWFLESRIFGTILLYILKRDNLVHKITKNKRSNVWSLISLHQNKFNRQLIV